MRVASENFKYFGHLVTEIFTLKKIVRKQLFHSLKHIFEPLNLSTLANYISIGRLFSKLSINLKNCIYHDVGIYVESITGSSCFTPKPAYSILKWVHNCTYKTYGM